MAHTALYYEPDALRHFGVALFERQGLPPDHAAIVMSGLIEANLRGIDSHGVARIPMYLTRLRRGVVNPRPQLRVERTAVAAVLESHGSETGLTLNRLLTGDPRPHFMASGQGDQILAGIHAHYPGADPGPPVVH